MRCNSISNLTFFALGAAALTTSCSSGGSDGPPPPQGPTSSLSRIDTSTDEDGIVPLPPSVDERIAAVFDRYAELTAPNGSRIHFLAQAGVSDAHLFRVRAIVREHLEDVSGSALGASKAGVFDAMANVNATLALYADEQSFDQGEVTVARFVAYFGDILQTMDASAIVQEGSPEYIAPDPAIDGTLETTVRFVLRFGVGAARPELDAQLATATLNALTNDRFRPTESTEEEDVDSAYLGLALSVYYGQWAHDPAGDGTAGPNGEYSFHDRASMQAGDPEIVSVIESFFSSIQRFPAYLDESFDGTFEMAFDPLLPYTHRSRYFERVGLRGTATARINGNEHDNTFLGNGVVNHFEGRGGDDTIEAAAGLDIAYYSGNVADYTISAVDDTVMRVTDSVPDRDGVDDLRQVVRLVFADGTIDL
ncbi:MAG: hypothetical protein AAF726_14975 [Planctomycetota bacterium]